MIDRAGRSWNASNTHKSQGQSAFSVLLLQRNIACPNLPIYKSGPLGDSQQVAPSLSTEADKQRGPVAPREGGCWEDMHTADSAILSGITAPPFTRSRSARNLAWLSVDTRFSSRCSKAGRMRCWESKGPGGFTKQDTSSSTDISARARIASARSLLHDPAGNLLFEKAFVSPTMGSGGVCAAPLPWLSSFDLSIVEDGGGVVCE